MDEKEFKKLLIDLELTQTEVGEAVGISQWGVTRYFRGELHNPDTRARIRAYLQKRADAMGLEIPDFWNEEAPVEST